MNNYLNYDKITDDLCIMGYNTILRFNVILSKKMENGNRRHFHNEYEYKSDKYINQNTLATIRRSFDYYISIENIRQNDDGNKEFIMIKIQDILFVREQLHLATKWFRDKEFANLFATKNNKLIMLGKPEPIYIGGLSGNKWLLIEPIVIEYETGQFTGIRIYLSSNTNYVDMIVDKFMGIVYLMNSINMYESAQLLLNYLQRPELGTNMFNFNTGVDTYEEEGYIESKQKRKIDSKKQKSFFDKMNEL